MEFTQWLPAIGVVITSLIIPFAVQLCATCNWSGNAKRWIALVFSIIAGVATALVTGTPTPESLAVWCFAIIGGVQTAYTAFKSVGVTCGWLDALLNVGNTASEEKVDL